MTGLRATARLPLRRCTLSDYRKCLLDGLGDVAAALGRQRIALLSNTPVDPTGGTYDDLAGDEGFQVGQAR